MAVVGEKRAEMCELLTPAVVTQMVCPSPHAMPITVSLARLCVCTGRKTHFC